MDMELRLMLNTATAGHLKGFGSLKALTLPEHSKAATKTATKAARANYNIYIYLPLRCLRLPAFCLSKGKYALKTARELGHLNGHLKGKRVNKAEKHNQRQPEYRDQNAPRNSANPLDQTSNRLQAFSRGKLSCFFSDCRLYDGIKSA